MKTIKTTTMPVGAAISRLVRLQFARRFIGAENPVRDREIDKLVDALNAFEVNLAFDCDMTDLDGNGIPDTIEKAQTALEVLICDAETECCRIMEREAGSGSREGRLISSRGD